MQRIVQAVGSVGADQIPEKQGSSHVVQKENTHQHHQTADHGHGQIGCRRPERLFLLVMGNPHVGSEGHHFKEDKGGKKVCGEEHPFRSAQGKQQEQIVPVCAVVTGKVFFGKKSAQKPHQRGDHAVQGTEAVQCKVQPHAADVRDFDEHFRNPPDQCLYKQIQSESKDNSCNCISKITAQVFVEPPDHITEHCRAHGQEYDREYLHFHNSNLALPDFV